MRYVVLLRGVNVGGKNKVAMAELKRHLENAGYQNVRTYINSGNVLLQSTQGSKMLCSTIEDIIAKHFTVDSSIIRVLALAHSQLKAVVAKKPKGFGEQPDLYHSDVIFLMGIATSDAIKVFNPREGVDTIWQGEGVIYSQRLSALRTKSRLNQIMGTPSYKAMTIRNWNTTTKLLDMLESD